MTLLDFPFYLIEVSSSCTLTRADDSWKDDSDKFLNICTFIDCTLKLYYFFMDFMEHKLDLITAFNLAIEWTRNIGHLRIRINLMQTIYLSQFVKCLPCTLSWYH